MPVFEPEIFSVEQRQFIVATKAGEGVWTPILRHGCDFGGEIFTQVMGNFVKNPNLNSSWLFRADILSDDDNNAAIAGTAMADASPRPVSFQGFGMERVLVRKLIPRNSKRDEPLNQTCMFLASVDEQGRPTRRLVVYIPHVSAAADLPFYHPKVRGIAHLHEWDPDARRGDISLHFWHFDQLEEDNDGEAAAASATGEEEEGTTSSGKQRLGRTARMMLSQLHRHGEGILAGYVQRVHHDTVVPRQRFQDTYTRLKNRYGRVLVDSWAEQTDPAKHVFEDLGIAAFLMELWADMYNTDDEEDVNKSGFPGFVDIGCGNGLLVYILRKEGYAGWGFDARARKSWQLYNLPWEDVPSPASSASDVAHPDSPLTSLQARVLLPYLAPLPDSSEDGTGRLDDAHIHDGRFPKGTFIISNHADELTPWTPVLAAQSQSPFIAIPCCSHDLTGQKFRAPPPADTSKGRSTYASLVAWVSGIAADCGFQVETEPLRIPSTRNTALIGRNMTGLCEDPAAIVAKYGGADGYYENVSKLLKTGPRGH